MTYLENVSLDVCVLMCARARGQQVGRHSNKRKEPRRYCQIVLDEEV